MEKTRSRSSASNNRSEAQRAEAQKTQNKQADDAARAAKARTEAVPTLEELEEKGEAPGRYEAGAARTGSLPDVDKSLLAPRVGDGSARRPRSAEVLGEAGKKCAPEVAEHAFESNQCAEQLSDESPAKEPLRNTADHAQKASQSLAEGRPQEGLDELGEAHRAADEGMCRARDAGDAEGEEAARGVAEATRDLDQSVLRDVSEEALRKVVHQLAKDLGEDDSVSVSGQVAADAKVFTVQGGAKVTVERRKNADGELKYYMKAETALGASRGLKAGDDGASVGASGGMAIEMEADSVEELEAKAADLMDVLDPTELPDPERIRALNITSMSMTSQLDAGAAGALGPEGAKLAAEGKIAAVETRTLHFKDGKPSSVDVVRSVQGTVDASVARELGVGAVKTSVSVDNPNVTLSFSKKETWNFGEDGVDFGEALGVMQNFGSLGYVDGDPDEVDYVLTFERTNLDGEGDRFQGTVHYDGDDDFAAVVDVLQNGLAKSDFAKHVEIEGKWVEFDRAKITSKVALEVADREIGSGWVTVESNDTKSTKTEKTTLNELFAGP